MPRHRDVINALRDAGIVITRQRVAVIVALAEGGGSLTVDEVLALVRVSQPLSDLETVKRTLNFLKGHDIVTEVDRGSGSATFDLSRSKIARHRLVCRSCGREFNLPGKYVTRLSRSIIHHLEFEIDAEALALPGLCAQCRAQTERRRRS